MLLKSVQENTQNLESFMSAIEAPTSHLELRAFEEKDFSYVIQGINSPELLVRFGGFEFPFPITNEALKDWVAQDGDIYVGMIEGEDAPMAIGEIKKISALRARLMRVVVFSPDLRGKGIGESMVRALLAKAVADFGIKEVELNVFDWNLSAIKCYEKVGFKKIPGKEKALSFDGKLWVAYRMGWKSEE